ncbi:MAG: Crp/Fnr family transcriptional regulator [Chloracidobacterium sp.]|nr:Crp/Fnr family transcriptional regulator [Chloracidobacterium sp.]
MPKLVEVELTFGEKIYERGGKIEYVYFPTSSLFSRLAVGPDELTLEMGVVGREGMTGYPVFVGDDRSDFRVIVLGSGKAMRMTAADFKFECKRDQTLRQMMLRFGQLRFMQASLASACHRVHGLEKRLVRWILMTSDRLQNRRSR